MKNINLLLGVIIFSLFSCMSNSDKIDKADKLMKLGKTIEALKYYYEVACTKDSELVFMQLGNYYYIKCQNIDSALKYYHKVFIYGQYTPQLLVNLGDLNYRKQDFDRAFNFFKGAEARDSLTPKLNYNFAIYFMNHEQLYEKALEYGLRELRIDSVDYENLNLVGQIYLNMDSTLKAIKLFSRSIDLKDDNYFSYFQRGCAFAENKQYELADKDFTKCIELKPSFQDAYNCKKRIEGNVPKYPQ